MISNPMQVFLSQKKLPTPKTTMLDNYWHALTADGFKKYLVIGLNMLQFNDKDTENKTKNNSIGNESVFLIRRIKIELINFATKSDTIMRNVKF